MLLGLKVTWIHSIIPLVLVALRICCWKCWMEHSDHVALE